MRTLETVMGSLAHRKAYSFAHSEILWLFGVCGREERRDLIDRAKENPKHEQA